MPNHDSAPPMPEDPQLARGEQTLAEALQRERRARRRLVALSVLLVAVLAGAAALAILWRCAVAESRRMAEQQLTAVRAREDAERQRDLAQRAAERARAATEAARRREERVRYAEAIRLAQWAWRDQDTHGIHTLLEGARPEQRGWEWHYLSQRPAPPAKAKQ